MTHFHSRGRKIAVAATGAVAAAILPLASVAQSAQAAPGAATDTPAAPTPPLVEKSKTGSYIVLMGAEPLVRSVKPQDLTKSPAKSKRKAMKAAHDKVLKGAGIAATRRTTEFTNALNGFAVRTDQKGADALARQKGVAVVIPDEMRQAQSIAADVEKAKADKAGVNALNNYLGLTGKKEAYGSGIDGSGILVGVIDTGIWPEQPMLKDTGGFPAKPTFDESGRSSCDFGNTDWNPNDKPFTCNNKLVGARIFLDGYKASAGLTREEFDSARDDNGHGTHTATTAAGNANVQSEIFGVQKDVVSGIAPRAQVIAYKALGEQGGLASDLSAAIDQAVADGVDVINYSIGGAARVVSADTISFLYAAEAGVFSAVSAGNSGPGAKTVGGPSNVPWVTSVGATTFPRNYAGSIHLGDGQVFKGTSVTKGTDRVPMIDGAKAPFEDQINSGLCLEGTLDPAKVKGKIVLCERGINGRLAKGQEVARAGGAGMVLFNAVDTDTMFSDTHFIPTVMIDKTPGEKIRAWVNSQTNPMGQLKNDGVDTLAHYSPTVTYFSSRGETIPNGDIIKPDISAPGAQIMAGATPFPAGGAAPSGQLWQAIAGTSMSGPVVAGSFALLKQAHPQWSPAAAKSALMTTASTAVRTNDRVSPATPFDTGSGFAQLGQPSKKGSAFQPGLVYDADVNDYLGFLCAEGPEAFTDAKRTCDQLVAAGIPTTAANLNQPSIGMEAVAGTQTVTRTVTNVTGKKLGVEAEFVAPPGYEVEVSPRAFALHPGQSQTYKVTVTNVSAKVGEWKFGSLTWEGMGYQVRSPIAVKGARFAAPTKITATGASGTATIPVSIGQAGTYTATPHGLVGVTHTKDTISQGSSLTKSFQLSGVKHARWKLQLPEPNDVDVYVFNPIGLPVGISTSAGTDVQIDLQDPMSGTYTVMLQGYSIPSPIEFDLKSWLVTEAAGSLKVTSGSPTVTTGGRQVSVGLSWSGHATGDTLLGGVTHKIDGVTVGTTDIEVTS